MSGQPKAYFDLSSVAALSRALLSASATAMPGVPSTVTRPSAPQWRPFTAGAVSFAEELWHALLAWAANHLGAGSAFCMDKRGFLVAQVGETVEVPPEILVAGFATFDQLLTASGLPTGGLAARLSLELGTGRLIQMWSFDWEGQELVVGFAGGRLATEAEANLVRQTFEQALREFLAARKEV